MTLPLLCKKGRRTGMDLKIQIKALCCYRGSFLQMVYPFFKAAVDASLDISVSRMLIPHII